MVESKIFGELLQGSHTSSERQTLTAWYYATTRATCAPSFVQF